MRSGAGNYFYDITTVYNNFSFAVLLLLVVCSSAEQGRSHCIPKWSPHWYLNYNYLIACEFRQP